MFEAPLNTVVIILFQSCLTWVPSSYLSSFGTTVHPSRTPANPIGFENEFTSIAHSFAPSISNIDLGSFLSRMNWLYAASKIIMDLFFLAKLTSSLSCSFVPAAPGGLFGLQKKMSSAFLAALKSGKKLFSGLHSMY